MNCHEAPPRKAERMPSFSEVKISEKPAVQSILLLFPQHDAAEGVAREVVPRYRTDAVLARLRSSSIATRHRKRSRDLQRKPHLFPFSSRRGGSASSISRIRCRKFSSSNTPIMVVFTIQFSELFAPEGRASARCGRIRAPLGEGWPPARSLPGNALNRHGVQSGPSKAPRTRRTTLIPFHETSCYHKGFTSSPCNRTFSNYFYLICTIVTSYYRFLSLQTLFILKFSVFLH